MGRLFGLKRLALAAAVGLVVGMVSQVTAQPTCPLPTGWACQFSTGCYELSMEYSGTNTCKGSEVSGTLPNCTCQQIVDNCKNNGAFYTGVSGWSADNGYGENLQCTAMGGSLVGAPPPQQCGFSCMWASGCEAIVTDPSGAYNDGVPVLTCDDAIAKCDADGQRFNGTQCAGTPIAGNDKCGFWCLWDTGCTEIVTDKTGQHNPNPVLTCDAAIASCDADGQRYGNNSCAGTPIGGEDVCGGYCLWDTGCTQLKTDKTGQHNGGVPVTSCTDVVSNCVTNGMRFQDGNCTVPWGNSVSHQSSASGATALRAFYSQGRVSVSWNAGTVISNAKISIVNAKGKTVASSTVKSNSSNLGAGFKTTLSTGMYFVRVDARDASGKRIVQQVPVQIVK